MRILWLLGFALVLALAVAACGGDDEADEGAATTEESAATTEEKGGGSIAADYDFAGKSFTVGSKDFTEQLVLGQITKQALEAAGAEVEDQIGLAGTVAAREALTSGEIDMYWEYTGTGWITHLGETKPIPDPREQYEAVAEADLAKNNVQWLEPAPANNTYALAISSEAKSELGVETISDIAQLAKDKPEEATVCIGNEFSTRDDGLPGLEKAYAFEFPQDGVATMQEGVIYDAVDKGDECNFGEVFATDGRLEALDLAVVEDDKSFFPVYNPSLNVRKDIVAETPELEDLFAAIAEKLDNETLQQLNAAVDVKGEPEEDVAENWLRESGFID
ncbi:MAG: glycine betaine ABC transporter substrate-binding protein [Actinobacteria bacterium]|nr:glycine betaine ABC transporter substrate-binding protein [Actinomycetota bacterium]